jgi:TRAP-type mannitol/chloroaromatic compound transport system permease small subunit
MESLIRTIDIFSKSVGHTFGWCVLILTASTCYEVFMRYVLNSPTVWAFDMSYMLYGALFMMSGAYAMSRGSHVRGDFIYRNWKPRTQAKVDLVLYFLFYFPAIFAMVFWPLKLIIFVAGLTLLLAGIAEVLRCIICIKTGKWLPRLGDVEELEVVLQQQHSEQTKS